jgi:hypothetical protein
MAAQSGPITVNDVSAWAAVPDFLGAIQISAERIALDLIQFLSGGIGRID